jgi:hypothetical protein
VFELERDGDRRGRIVAVTPAPARRMTTSITDPTTMCLSRSSCDVPFLALDDADASRAVAIAAASRLASSDPGSGGSDEPIS